MKSVGVFCLVWQESRYLPLVLEQMQLVGGPAVVYWQDKPLYWTDESEPPSGHSSPVKDILPQFKGIEVVKIDQAPRVEPYGGFAALIETAFTDLREKYRVETVLLLDSDWLFDLDDWLAMLVTIRETSVPSYFASEGRHYYRDFTTLMAASGITFGFPAHRPDIFLPVREEPTHYFPQVCHHPAYALNDVEMFRKVNSFGHAPLFKERQFYEKEWLGRDDSLVKPFPASHPLPVDLERRLARWHAHA